MNTIQLSYPLLLLSILDRVFKLLFYNIHSDCPCINGSSSSLFNTLICYNRRSNIEEITGINSKLFGLDSKYHWFAGFYSRFKLSDKINKFLVKIFKLIEFNLILQGFLSNKVRTKKLTSTFGMKASIRNILSNIFILKKCPSIEFSNFWNNFVKHAYLIYPRFCIRIRIKNII